MLALHPIGHIGRRAFGRLTIDLEAIACEQWAISPGTRRYIPPARFLRGQLDKIQATEFGSPSEIIRGFRGDYESIEAPTRGLRIRDVDLIDGVLYARGAAYCLRPRRRRIPLYRRPQSSMAKASMYESWMGNRWFGMWLLEDCLSYELTKDVAPPVKTAAPPTRHQGEYELRLGLQATSVGDVHFDELILFRDASNNEGRRRRADLIKQRLNHSSPEARHPGVFLLRGKTGERRLLLNELEIAERFAAERNFQILDPSFSPLSKIVEACAGARVVAGVEGSHLCHGLAIMPNDAALLVIQPADRVVAALKIVTDRQGQRYGFVVGTGEREGFRVAWEDVARTLDLLGEP